MNGHSRNFYWTLLALLLAVLLHLACLSLFVNWPDVVDNPPIHYTDYASHYAKVWAAVHNLEAGHLWGYSPYFHAGHPAGTLFDVDNNGVGLATWVAYRLGMSLPHAFNAIVLALMVLAPLALFAAARTVGLTLGASVLALFMGLALWYGDPTASWTWQGGPPSTGAATFGSLAVAAGFWRWAGFGVENPGRSLFSRSNVALLLWFGLGPVVFWLHPWAFFYLVFPLAVGTLLRWRAWTWRQRLVPLIWAVWIVVLNLPWLLVLFSFLSTKTNSAQFLQGGWSQLLDDARTPHMALRLTLLGLGVLGLARWQRQKIQLWVPIAMSIVAWLALAYLGVYAGAGDLQPYRFVIPALALSTLPAAYALVQTWQRSPRRALLLLTVFVLAAGLALYVGRPRRRLQNDDTPRDYLSGPSPAEHEVCETLAQFDLQSGRVLTNDWRLGAYLPPCSGAQVIGGPFLWVWTTYGHTNAGLDDVLGRPLADTSPQELENSLVRYNIRWAVVNTRIHPEAHTLSDWQRDHPGLLEPVVRHGVFEIYALRRPSTWFIEGEGSVFAGHNRLEVTAASPGGLVLKYHWIDSLRTEPDMPIRPVYVGQDPVPFIAVENGDVKDFSIVQDYQ